jgi:hypothetical protein
LRGYHREKNAPNACPAPAPSTVLPTEREAVATFLVTIDLCFNNLPTIVDVLLRLVLTPYRSFEEDFTEERKGIGNKRFDSIAIMGEVFLVLVSFFFHFFFGIWMGVLRCWARPVLVVVVVFFCY